MGAKAGMFRVTVSDSPCQRANDDCRMTVAIITVSVALCTAPVIFLKSKNSNYMNQIHFTVFYLDHIKTMVIKFFNLYKKMEQIQHFS